MNSQQLDIEKIKLTPTEEKVLMVLYKQKKEKLSANEITSITNVLKVTVSNGIKSLLKKNLIEIENERYFLSCLGIKMMNFITFRNLTLIEFCKINQINYNEFIRNKNLYSMKMIIGIHNLINQNQIKNTA